MVGNLLGWLVFVAVVVLFGWLTWRAWHIRRGILKWPAVVLGGLLTLLLALVAVLIGRGLAIAYAPHPVPAISLAVESTPERVARGQHLAESVCAACHTETGELPLSGGHNLSDDAHMPLGNLYAPNLTPAGPVTTLSDADIWRIFRYGIFPNGRQTMMPLTRLHNLSDEDVMSVIAYLRSQPAVERTTPQNEPSLLLAAFLGAGLFKVDIDPPAGAVIAPPKGPTAEFGAYIISYNDCRDCHGEKLDGHPTGPGPAGPNLRVVQAWTTEQFIATIRTGVDPTGHALQPPMPWKIYAHLDDDELTAVYQYLHGLPAVTAQR
jgi:mono/diheme cytochrome c family protein